MAAVNREELIRDNRRISIQIEQMANSSMAEQDLTAMQANMLRYILRHSQEGTSLTAIHREFGYSMAALSGMLKRLRKKGYVRVEPCNGDDRRKLLFGTRQGEEMRDYLDRAMNAAQDRLCNCFSPEELESLDHLQKKLLQNLSELSERKQNKEASES